MFVKSSPWQLGQSVDHSHGRSDRFNARGFRDFIGSFGTFDRQLPPSSLRLMRDSRPCETRGGPTVCWNPATGTSLRVHMSTSGSAGSQVGKKRRPNLPHYAAFDLNANLTRTPRLHRGGRAGNLRAELHLWSTLREESPEVS